jgi:hypothetical protein
MVHIKTIFMKFTVVVLCILLTSSYFNNLSAQEKKLTNLINGLLFTSIGFFSLSTAYYKDIQENSRNITKGVSLVFLGFGVNSFYKASIVKDEKDEYAKFDDRLLAGLRFQNIFNGLIFLYVASNIHASDDITEEGRLYFDIGRYTMVSCGILSFVKAFWVYRTKKIDIETKGKIIDNSVLNSYFFINKDLISISVNKKF